MRIIAVLLVVVLAVSAVCSASVITVGVNADTQIRGGWAATYNYGTAADLYPSVTTGNSANNYTTLLRFDLSAVESTINSAQLKLYKVNNTTSALSYIAYMGTNSDWVESQVTYNVAKTGTNWATAGGDYDASFASAYSTGVTAGATWVTLDVTSIVQEMKDRGYTSGTFFVKSNSTSASDPRMTAKEATMWTPTNPTAPTDKFATLTVDSVAVPEPATMALLALGGLSLLARRRSRA